MLILRLFTLLLIIAIIVFFITQVVIPAWKGTKWFWIFRKGTGQHALETAHEQVAESDLHEEAKKLVAAGTCVSLSEAKRVATQRRHRKHKHKSKRRK